MTSCHELQVWQKAMDLVLDCYALTSRFPKSEMYGLSAQLQRSAVSVPSNIAEGAGRLHTREFIRHLGISRGSLFEMETPVLLSCRLEYVNEEAIRPLLASIAEIGRMLYGLIASLERRLETTDG
jgi:four helix bundle protein